MARTPGGDFHHHITDSAIGFAWDDGELSWAPSLEKNPEFESEKFDDGYLFGKPDAVAAVRRQLFYAPATVTLGEEIDYTFTENRDTLPDLLAAMVLLGHRRGVLTDEGWGVLEKSPGARLYDPEPEPGQVITQDPDDAD